MGNRLHLDFKLKTQVERNEFVTKYVEQPEFKIKPLTPDELETIGNYILWGENEQGLNGRQSKNFDLKTRYGTWDGQKTESLEALIESPTFNEAKLEELGEAPQKKIREVFDREKELERAGSMRPDLEDLCQRIDELDYQIEVYELNHGRRTKEIREELIDWLNRWGSDLEELEEKVEHWGQYQYLKKRHELVELRREQYTLRDSYAAAIVPLTLSQVQLKQDLELGVQIKVLPFGIKEENEIGKIIFQKFDDINPQTAAGHEKMLSDFYWRKKEDAPTGTELFIDFRNGFHVQKLIGMIDELVEMNRTYKEDQKISNLDNFLKTFEYYVNEAELDEVQLDLLKMRMESKKNADIADALNQKYGKSYTNNYISTIFCGKVVEKICAAANKHVELVENIFYPENWKKCTSCGRLLLKNSDNFTKKTRSRDGFNTKCKKCEKRIRQEKQESTK